MIFLGVKEELDLAIPIEFPTPEGMRQHRVSIVCWRARANYCKNGLLLSFIRELSGLFAGSQVEFSLENPLLERRSGFN
jgi:hypothetical protein